jgi:hypothetical protein
MSEQKGKRRSLLKAGLAVLAVLAILLALLFTFVTKGRKRWIGPVPGVSLKMSHPPVAAADLGPNSAYRLLLKATREPPPSKPGIWVSDWASGLCKVLDHPWPDKPPPSMAERVAALKAQDTAAKARKKAEFVKEHGAGSETLMPLDDLPEHVGSFTFTPPTPEERAAANDAPWTREQYEDARRILAFYRPNLPVLDQALAAPNPQMPTVQTAEESVPYLAPARHLADFLCFLAVVRAQEGHYDEAFELLNKSAQLGSLVSRGGTIIHHLVGTHCAVLACVSGTNLALRHDIPSGVLKQAAQEFLACADEAEPFVEALRAGAHEGIQSVDLLYDALVGTGGTGGGSGLTFFGRHPFLLRLVGSTRSETKRDIRACYEHIVARELKGPVAGATYTATLFDALQKKRSKAEVLFRLRDPLGMLYAVTVLPAVPQARAKAMERDAELRGTALFLAVKAYVKGHGQLPEDCASLVPSYLPRIPVDPFSGKPFRYLRDGVPGLPEGTWAVYSTGKNGADDGGTAASIGSWDAHRRDFNPDIVWPSHEYPKPGDAKE